MFGKEKNGNVLRAEARYELARAPPAQGACANELIKNYFKQLLMKLVINLSNNKIGRIWVMKQQYKKRTPNTP